MIKLVSWRSVFSPLRRRDGLVVVAGLITTAVALGMIADRAMQPPAVFTTEPGRIAALAPLPATGYLTAARDLPVGTLVRDDDFVTKALPPGQVPEGALPALPDAVAGIRGGMIRRRLDAGSAVAVADILRPRDRGYLGAVLAPG